MLAFQEPPEAKLEAYWIDPGAPLEVVELTIAVRNAFLRLIPDEHYGLHGNCWEASGLVGLAARRLGFPDVDWEAVYLREWPHVVLRVGRWWFDPTAEQFGESGPIVFEAPDFDAFLEDLNPCGVPPLTTDAVKRRCEERGLDEIAPALFRSVGLTPPW